MNSSKWHIAQLNIAAMLGKDINEPVMAEFVAQLDTINALRNKAMVLFGG